MIDLLNAAARREPDAPFVIHGSQTYSFGAIDDLAMRGATMLAAQRIEPGDRVVIAVSNRPLFLFYWFAVLARGAVAVPISHEAFGDALRYIVQQSAASALLTEASETGRIGEALVGLAVRVVGLDGEDAFAAQVRQLPRHPEQASTASMPNAILYTSGTTGQPKGAVIPAESYRAAGREIVDAVGITRADRILVFLPLHHANPQMYALMSALTVGCSLVLVARFSASQLLAQAAEHGATGFTYVGTVLAILSKTLTGAHSTTLRWCVGGGAPKPVWTDLVDKLGIRIHELYGMTETGAVTSINRIGATRVGSVGLPRKDFDVALLDDDDRIVTDGIGEIAVRPRAPWLMTTGYFDKPTETVATIGNLWFHTGDYGRMDADGYLFFEGRKKELIRRAGEMIAPATIELVAARHAAVDDCAAVGVPDEILGEEIKLVVVTRHTIDCGDLVAYLRLHLARHEIPRYIDFVDSIPRTPTEKIQRFKLAAHSPRLVDLKQQPH